MNIKMNGVLLAGTPIEVKTGEGLNVIEKGVQNGIDWIGSNMSDVISSKVSETIYNAITSFGVHITPILPDAAGFVAMICMLIVMVTADPKWFSRGLLAFIFAAIVKVM